MQVSYDASLREAVRLLKEHGAKLQRGQVVKDADFDAGQHQSSVTRVGVLLQRMSDELTAECERVAAWGVLGQGTGGRLVRPDENVPVDREDLIGTDNCCCEDVEL